MSIGTFMKCNDKGKSCQRHFIIKQSLMLRKLSSLATLLVSASFLTQEGYPEFGLRIIAPVVVLIVGVWVCRLARIYPEYYDLYFKRISRDASKIPGILIVALCVASVLSLVFLKGEFRFSLQLAYIAISFGYLCYFIKYTVRLRDMEVLE